MSDWSRVLSLNSRSNILGLLSIVLLFTSFITPVDAARVVAGKRECATCHIAWISDFKREDITTLIPYEPRPTVNTGKQDVVSTDRMCFSCHDGFALDSRPLWIEGGHNHPVGMVPSDNVNLSEFEGKTVFPLNDDGKVYCGTCHSAHGLSWQESESPIFLRLPNVASSLCMTCHANKSEVTSRVDHPITRTIKEFPEKLAAEGGMFTKNKEITCQSCHTPHAASSRPLMVMDNRKAGLCTQCHTDKANLPGTKHDLTVMAPETKNRKGEVVSEYGTCLGCHVMHEADDSAPLWGRDEIIPTQDRAEQLCRSCHKKNGLAKDKNIAAHSHPVNVSVDKLGISPKEDGWHSNQSVTGADLEPLPLYDAEGIKSSDATHISCPTCHNPHNWNVKEKFKGDPKKVDGDGQSSFLRIPQGTNSALCINCHVDKRSVLQSKHSLIGNKERKILQQSPTIKIGLDQGACGSCHRAHNGRGAVMSPIESRNNQSYIQSICTTCHDKGGIAEEKTTGKHSHPLLRNLSKVGDKTSLPLFNKTGQRHPRGRVDCATCHNPHQWDPAKPLSTAGRNKEVDGDGRTSFLRLPAAPGSDLCVDCHRNKRPVRGTDHDLRVTAKNAVNHQGLNVTQSGVCGQCHSVHNANSRLALWARKTASDMDPQMALCLSCHSVGAAAESKIPDQVMRPHGILLWSNQLRVDNPQRHSLPDIPVFDRNGNRTRVGRIRCASCHNPHVWDADRPREGRGSNIEGDVTNSFLRNASSSQIVCADCHGADAIYRYKYFHGETSRKPHGLYR